MTLRRLSRACALLAVALIESRLLPRPCKEGKPRTAIEKAVVVRIQRRDIFRSGGRFDHISKPVCPAWIREDVLLALTVNSRIGSSLACLLRSGTSLPADRGNGPLTWRKL